MNTQDPPWDTVANVYAPPCTVTKDPVRVMLNDAGGLPCQ